MKRRRARRAGLAIVIVGLAAAATAAAAFAFGRPVAAWQLVVRGNGGETLLSVPLPEGRFTLRYRNSVYASLAEERFVVASDGRMELVGLAADEQAVLDEYYATVGARPAATGDSRRWLAEPATPLRLEQLPLAATEHGRRTLVVAGREVPLWQLSTAGQATVVLEVAPVR